MIKKSYIWKSLYLESCFISCKNGKHLASIHDLVITCDEILEEIKTVPVLMKKKVQKSFYFTCLFINYDSIINSCYHLLLSDKISKKKKKKLPYYNINNKLRDCNWNRTQNHLVR